MLKVSSDRLVGPRIALTVPLDTRNLTYHYNLSDLVKKSFLSSTAQSHLQTIKTISGPTKHQLDLDQNCLAL